jgi:hypothetical protein
MSGTAGWRSNRRAGHSATTTPATMGSRGAA